MTSRNEYYTSSKNVSIDTLIEKRKHVHLRNNEFQNRATSSPNVPSLNSCPSVMHRTGRNHWFSIRKFYKSRGLQIETLEGEVKSVVSEWLGFETPDNSKLKTIPTLLVNQNANERAEVLLLIPNFSQKLTFFFFALGGWNQACSFVQSSVKNLFFIKVNSIFVVSDYQDPIVWSKIIQFLNAKVSATREMWFEILNQEINGQFWGKWVRWTWIYY